MVCAHLSVLFIDNNEIDDLHLISGFWGEGL